MGCSLSASEPPSPIESALLSPPIARSIARWMVPMIGKGKNSSPDGVYDTDGQAVFKSRQNVVGQILHHVQQWAFRLPLLVGQILHLHTRQFTGMITSLG